jgi:multisubunit Na+/H+ antiporter MnhB subunit
VVATASLLLFARAFGEDTEEARRRARTVMKGVYALIFALGVAFLVYAFAGRAVQYRTAVQAAIFLALGAGGFAIGLRRRRFTGYQG